VRHLLLTQKGEKEYDKNFGTDLTRLLFQYQIGDPSLEAAIDDTIREAVETYLTGVSINSIVIEPLDTKDGAVVVKIDFQADLMDPANLEFTVTPDGGAEDSAGGVTSTLL